MAFFDIIKKGSVDRSVRVKVIDSADGTPETSVAFDTAGVDLWYRRELGAKVAITEATLAALDTAHADGGFKHIADGVCRLDLPDAAFAAGAQYVEWGGTFTGMIVIGGCARLVDVDLDSPLANGITSVGTLDAGSTSGGTLPSGQRANVRAGHWILPTSTSAIGEGRIIDAYNAGTGVFTVSPAFDNSVSGATYVVFASPPAATTLPFPSNVTQWKGSTAPDNTGDAFALLGTPDGASVSADVLTLINELGAAAAATGVPVAGDPLAAKVAFIIAHLINKVTYDEATGLITLRNAADSADMATRTDSVAGTVHTKGILT